MSTLVVDARWPVPAAGRAGPVATARHSLAIARRNLLSIRSDPSQLLDATVLPIVVTLIFVYVFGGAIGGAIGGDTAAYRQYLLPGIMVQTISFAAMSTGIALNLDFATGMIDRFRSLPIARSAVLTGRVGADLCRLALGQVVIFTFALIIGFRITEGPLRVLAAVALLLAYGGALTWIAAVIGLSVRSSQAVQTLGFLWLAPLQFASSIFAPTATMPGWLQAFVKVNPTTLVTDSCRGLLLGGPLAGPLTGAIAWIIGLLVVFVPLSVTLYRRRG